MTKTAYDMIVDASGEDCPIPMIHAKNALDSMISGQVLKLLFSKEGTIRNIKTLVATNPYELISESKVDKKFVFLIKKL